MWTSVEIGDKDSEVQFKIASRTLHFSKFNLRAEILKHFEEIISKMPRRRGSAGVPVGQCSGFLRLARIIILSLDNKCASA